MIESGVKLDKIEGTEAKKLALKKKEGETHAVSYQRKAYNPSYSRQLDRCYRSYNQYTGGNSQGNYQPNIRPVACFPALPALAYGGNSQPSGQRENNVRRARPQQERPKFDPIPMTYTELYPKLVQLGFLVPMDIPPMQPPYPRWYKENAWCDYHSENKGHSMEDCTALKQRVHDLIKVRALAFDNEDTQMSIGILCRIIKGPK